MTDNTYSPPPSEYGENPSQQQSFGGLLTMLGQLLSGKGAQQNGALGQQPVAQPSIGAAAPAGSGTTGTERQQQALPTYPSVAGDMGQKPTSPTSLEQASVPPLPPERQVPSAPAISLAAQATPVVNAPSDLAPIFSSAESKYGLPAGYLANTARIESGFNSKAVSPTGALGGFQIIPSTAKELGVTDPTDWNQATEGAAKLAQQNLQYMQAHGLGDQITSGQLYFAHQQGATGATAMLTHPDMPAVDALQQFAGLSPKAAAQHITANGGNASMTGGQFFQLWDGKFNQIDPHEYQSDGSKVPVHAPGAHPALVAAHKSGNPMMALAMMQALAPSHTFTPVNYDPFKVMPPAMPWQPVGR